MLSVIEGICIVRSNSIMTDANTQAPMAMTQDGFNDLLRSLNVNDDTFLQWIEDPSIPYLQNGPYEHDFMAVFGVTGAPEVQAQDLYGPQTSMTEYHEASLNKPVCKPNDRPITTDQPRRHQDQTGNELTARQCFDHGCNGKIFSCRENYMRHVREKSGRHSVSCRFCGCEFSRRSNLEKHVSEGRCANAPSMSQTEYLEVRSQPPNDGASPSELRW